MWIVFTLGIMGFVGFTYWKEGVFAAFCMLVATLLSGIITFQFWEPLAAGLASGAARSMFAGYEDALCLMGLFCLSLLSMRAGIQSFTKSFLLYHPYVQQFGGLACGLLNGYLLSGFLLCVFQTLPWHQHFLGFTPRQLNEPPFRRIFPADRVWLAMMRHAGAFPFAGSRDADATGSTTYDLYNTFDRDGTFELRYLRYRRTNDKGEVLPYRGELDMYLLP